RSHNALEIQMLYRGILTSEHKRFNQQFPAWNAVYQTRAKDAIYGAKASIMLVFLEQLRQATRLKRIEVFININKREPPGAPFTVGNCATQGVTLNLIV